MSCKSSAGNGAEAFFRDLRGAFERTPTDALMPLAWDSFDGNVAVHSEGQPPIACHKKRTCVEAALQGALRQRGVDREFRDATVTGFDAVAQSIRHRRRRRHATCTGSAAILIFSSCRDRCAFSRSL